MALFSPWGGWTEMICAPSRGDTGDRSWRGPSLWWAGLFALVSILAWGRCAEAALGARTLAPGEAATLNHPVEGVVRSATLYYRPAGVRRYQRRELTVAHGEVAITLPPEAVVPPGIEYYLEITTAGGVTITDPPRSPRYNPYRVAVRPPPRPAVALAADPSRPLPPDAPLTVELGAGPAGPRPVRVEVDGTDVTQAVRTTAGGLTYTPAAPLAPGGHRITVTLDHGQEVTLPFAVAGETRRPAAGVLRADGTFSFNYGLNAASSGAPSGDRTSANLHLGLTAKKGDFSAAFSGVNLQYVKGAPKPYTLSSGYLLKLAYGEQHLDLGDLSISETPLTVSGFARRGGQLRLVYHGIEAHLFSVNAQTVEGFDPGLSLGGDQVYGAAIKAPLLAGGRLTLHLSAVTGELTGGAGFNTATRDAPARGDAIGLNLSGDLLGFTLDGEVAGSWFDADTTTGPGKVSDRAYELTLSRDVGIGTLSTHLLRYGSDFRSIANPNFTGDRQAVEANLTSGLSIATLALHGSYAEDNVDNDPARPVVTSSRAGATLGVAPAGWPALNLGYNLGIQDSRDEPADTAGVKNLQHDISLGLTYARGIWNASLTTSIGLLDDRLASDRDTETRNVVLAGGLNTGPLSLAPSLSYTESESGGKTNRSRLASLTLAVPVWPQVVDLSGQGSYQWADASDRSSDTRTTNGSVRLSWNLKPLLARAHLGWTNVQVALSADYSRVEDRIDPANDQEQSTTLVTLNLGAPYRFGWGWEMGW